MRDRWGGTIVVSRGRLHDTDRLEGLVAEDAGRPAGLLTYRIDAGECEIVTLDALVRGAGAGTALLQAAADLARRAGCRRLWLITTNDNLDALRFYQRRGLTLAAVHARAVEASRRLKPGIPQVGEHGILIRDEIELERWLEPAE
ncbi:MAG TPA: GNAT family N-acetyltransferase [bacterium]|nr:GNAT family N-acetyltransferase [bacterium]